MSRTTQYEGSPELGYLSRNQLAEFVELRAQETNQEQLFSTRDPKKTAQFATYVFNNLIKGCDISLYYVKNIEGSGHKGQITRTYGGDEVILGTTFEVAADDPEIGLLINLDYLDKLLSSEQGTGFPVFKKLRLTGKTGQTVRDYIQERKAFLGIDNRGEV